MRIELTYPAWKAGVLPLNYTRIISDTSDIISQVRDNCKMFLKFFMIFSTFFLPIRTLPFVKPHFVLIAAAHTALRNGIRSLIRSPEAG